MASSSLADHAWPHANGRLSYRGSGTRSEHVCSIEPSFIEPGHQRLAGYQSLAAARRVSGNLRHRSRMPGLSSGVPMIRCPRLREHFRVRPRLRFGGQFSVVARKINSISTLSASPLSPEGRSVRSRRTSPTCGWTRASWGTHGPKIWRFGRGGLSKNSRWRKPVSPGGGRNSGRCRKTRKLAQLGIVVVGSELADGRDGFVALAWLDDAATPSRKLAAEEFLRRPFSVCRGRRRRSPPFTLKRTSGAAVCDLDPSRGGLQRFAM
jgi:hypothetical protein